MQLFKVNEEHYRRRRRCWNALIEPSQQKIPPANSGGSSHNYPFRDAPVPVSSEKVLISASKNRRGAAPSSQNDAIKMSRSSNGAAIRREIVGRRPRAAICKTVRSVGGGRANTSVLHNYANRRKKRALQFRAVVILEVTVGTWPLPDATYFTFTTRGKSPGMDLERVRGLEHCFRGWYSLVLQTVCWVSL